MPNAAADPREVPRYTIAEAAHNLHVAPATLRSWVLGRPYATRAGRRHWPRVIGLSHGSEKRLSYSNLIEAHVLRSLRVEHGVAVRAVRDAIKVAAKQFGIDRLLLSEEMRAAPGKVFLETYADLVELTASGQVAIRAVFEKHLERIEWGTDGPLRLFPFYSTAADDAKRSISISPGVSSGRPVIARRGVSTAVIVDRLDAGETTAEIASDLGLDPPEVIEAATYERAA